MAVDGCAKCVKYLLFAFNLIFWLLGCAILGIGLYVRFSPESQKVFSGGEFHMLNAVQHTGAYVLIGVGACMMVLGFLGCCGAIRENQCLLIMFFASLLLIFVVLLAIGIWAFIMLNIRENETKEELRTMIYNKVGQYSTESEFMDSLQRALGCCGSNNKDDYAAFSLPVPESCGDPIVNSIQQDTGCTDKTLQAFRESVLFIGAAGVIVAIMLIFGMVFSMCLCCAIRRSGEIA